MYFPNRKNDPSLDPPGDFGKGLFVLLEMCESFENERVTVWCVFMYFGGEGLVENTDIVAEGGTLVELESVYHGPVDSEADVRAESLVNLASFAKANPAERVSDRFMRRDGKVRALRTVCLGRSCIPLR